VERCFPLVDLRVCRDYRFGRALPQLLYIAEYGERIPVLQIVVERTEIGFFTGLKVVRSVPFTPVHVRENAEAIGVGIESPGHLVRPPVQVPGSPQSCGESRAHPRFVQ
jgi:hypothetical protein